VPGSSSCGCDWRVLGASASTYAPINVFCVSRVSKLNCPELRVFPFSQRRSNKFVICSFSNSYKISSLLNSLKFLIGLWEVILYYLEMGFLYKFVVEFSNLLPFFYWTKVKIFSHFHLDFSVNWTELSIFITWVFGSRFRRRIPFWVCA